jgi:hypothetical protein
MRKQTNTLSPSPKCFQSPKFSDSDIRKALVKTVLETLVFDEDSKVNVDTREGEYHLIVLLLPRQLISVDTHHAEGLVNPKVRTKIFGY